MPTKAIVFPSGDQRGLLSGSSWSELLVSDPPSAGITQTSLFRFSSYSLPVLFETKAIRVPSGDQCGSESFHSFPSVICFEAPLFTSTTQRCVRLSSYQPVSLNL